MAHLGYFHNEHLRRERWLTAEIYWEAVALSQALPGAPASSQTGIAIGPLPAGYLGGLLAFWRLPPKVVMVFAAVAAEVVATV